jgi:hypothetical protein
LKHPVQSSAPNDGRKHRQKHVELTRNNKLTYIVASCWLLSESYHDARIHERHTRYESPPVILKVITLFSGGHLAILIVMFMYSY